MLPVVQRTEIQEPETFTDGSIDGVVFRTLKPHADRHGWRLDLYREDETPAENYPVMAYICETQPGVARGPHEHAEQSEYIAFAGPGEFTLYLAAPEPKALEVPTATGLVDQRLSHAHDKNSGFDYAKVRFFRPGLGDGIGASY